MPSVELVSMVPRPVVGGRCRLAGVLVALGWLLAAAAPAQQTAAAPPPDATPTAPAGPVSGPADPATAAAGAAPTQFVVRAVSNDADPNRIGLGYTVAVYVTGLREHLAQAGADCRALTLFIQDVPVKGLEPDSCDLADGRIRFTLVREEDSAAAWRLLFTEPWEFTNRVSLSVGPNERLSWPTSVRDLELVILPELWVYTFFVTLALAFLLLVWLARKTALLRDRGEGMPEGAKAPYSLARFQLACWLFLVVAAYVFIWMITGELDTITGSVLALLGIGSGTALGAAMIDQNRDERVAAAPPPAAVVAVPAGAPPPAPSPAVKSTVSRGFIRDVLSDEGGISIHRFQLFVWTLVLGLIFAAAVFNTLAMPQFSPTLLGLMGISSGTYLGLKVPEGTPARRE